MSEKTHSKPIALTRDDFQRLVLDADKPVVVDFWAQWCRPCVAMAPSLDHLSGEFADSLTIAKVDIETGDNEELAREHHVQGFPSLLFFHKGKEVKRLVGALPRARLHIEFEQFLASEGLIVPAQQEAFDQAEAAADEANQKRQEAAGAAYRLKTKDAFDALDQVRKELLQVLADELPADQRATALRGAAGEFDEEVYKLFAAHRGKIDEEERFKHLAERSEVAITALNSGDGETAKTEMFAEIERADAEYNAAVDQARRTYLTPPQA